MSLLEIIDRRISVRTYTGEVPGDELLDRIKRILHKERKGPFGSRHSFQLIDVNEKGSDEIGKMTSYGMIKNAGLYFGGYSDCDDRTIIDYGYCFEEVLLELTVLGLGTCWLGGTFGRGFVAEKLNLPDGKVIPAISPIGFSSEKRSVTEKITRFIAGSGNRKSHNKLFFSHSGDEVIVPAVLEDLRSPIDKILESVRFGPSASNKQPWRIVVNADVIHFFCDYNKTYNAMIKGFNIQSLDMGIALCHFTKAAEELRMRGRLSYSDPHFENTKWTYILSWKIGK